MQKQHHPATIFFLVVAIIVAAVLGWHASELKKRLHASVLETAEVKQRLERETNTRIGAEQELAALRSALSGQEAALHEFMQRVHVIHDIALDITIEATTATEETNASIPVIAAELVAADGRVWRFMNDFEQAPTTERTNDDTVRMTFTCNPVRSADIQGRPIAELDGVTRLRAPYQPVLAGMGFTVAPPSTKQLVLRLDGMEVVNTAPTPMGPDTWDYDVTVAFTGLYDRYQGQLKDRISAAAKARASQDGT